jgi:hypothetical protein
MRPIGMHRGQPDKHVVTAALTSEDPGRHRLPGWARWPSRHLNAVFVGVDRNFGWHHHSSTGAGILHRQPRARVTGRRQRQAIPGVAPHTTLMSGASTAFMPTTW